MCLQPLDVCSFYFVERVLSSRADDVFKVAILVVVTTQERVEVVDGVPFPTLRFVTCGELYRASLRHYVFGIFDRLPEVRAPRGEDFKTLCRVVDSRNIVGSSELFFSPFFDLGDERITAIPVSSNLLQKLNNSRSNIASSN